MGALYGLHTLPHILPRPGLPPHHTPRTFTIQCKYCDVYTSTICKKEEAHTVVLHFRITSVWSAKIPSENVPISGGDNLFKNMSA